MSNSRSKTLMLAYMGILTAIVIVLQALAIGIRFGVFNITLVLVPIVVGAALYGWKAGGWLGFIFGIVVLCTDAGVFLAINVPGTIITCILKGVLAGMAAAAVYKLLENKNRWAAIIAAAVVCPVVNTGVFLLGCLLFFRNTIAEWAAGASFDNIGTYMIAGFVGVNFLVELAINLALSTAIVQIVNIVKKPSAAAPIKNSAYVPKCPTCGSDDVEKIDKREKGAGIVLFGFFSKNFGKVFHCKNCDYRW